MATNILNKLEVGMLYKYIHVKYGTFIIFITKIETVKLLNNPAKVCTYYFIESPSILYKESEHALLQKTKQIDGTT